MTHLFTLRRRLEIQGRTLILAGVHGPLRRVIEGSHLDEVFIL
jgi:anti-anti-sigma regulatory factor